MEESAGGVKRPKPLLFRNAAKIWLSGNAHWSDSYREINTLKLSHLLPVFGKMLRQYNHYNRNLPRWSPLRLKKVVLLAKLTDYRRVLWVHARPSPLRPHPPGRVAPRTSSDPSGHLVRPRLWIPPPQLARGQVSPAGRTGLPPPPFLRAGAGGGARRL